MHQRQISREPNSGWLVSSGLARPFPLGVGFGFLASLPFGLGFFITPL